MKTYKCQHCGKTNESKRTDRYIKYCNWKCYQKAHAKTIKKYNCYSCNEEFNLLEVDLKRRLAKGNKIYCSDLCRRTHNQILVAKKHNVIAVTIDNKFYVKKCKICGHNFEVIKQKANRVVCSEDCRNENTRTNESRKEKISKAFTGPKHPNYIHDRDRSKVRDAPTRVLKNEALKLFGHKCFKCGQENNLCMDHHYPNIKGWSLTISNCVVLCKSCNSSKSAKDPELFYTKKELAKLKSMGIRKDNLFNFIQQ